MHIFSAVPLSEIQSYYINRISYRLDRFVQKSNTLWNFRCPFCKDSTVSKRKARAYFVKSADGIRFKCHNGGCDLSYTFKKFLEVFDYSLYQEYYVEVLKKKSGSSKFSTPKPVKLDPSIPSFVKKSKVIELDKFATRIDCLPKEHYARVYLEQYRKLPHLDLLYYTPEYGKLVFPVKTDQPADARIVIPFYSKNCKELIAIQGRALESASMRYITTKVEQSAPKIFGLERVKEKGTIFIFEGPLDSLLVPNSLACADTNLEIVESHVKPVDGKFIYVFDNQSRSKTLVKKMERLIAKDKHIFIWPAQYATYKDINDLHVRYDKIDIREFILNNTFTKTKLKKEFLHWKKI